MDVANLVALASGLTALVGMVYQALAQRQSAHLARRAQQLTEDDSFYARARELWGENEQLRASLERYEHQQAEIDALRAEQERIHQLLPLLVVAGRLDVDMASDGLAFVFDRSSDLIVISSPSEGGSSWRWVNARWAEVLGCRSEDLLGAGWRSYLHPDDLATTRRTETLTWRNQVDGFYNRFRNAAGGYVAMRWYAERYRDGFSLALAIVEEPSSPAIPAPPVLVNNP